MRFKVKSCKSSTQVSLNFDNFKSQPESFNTLISFRCSRWAITADITKMFRQININDYDKNLSLSYIEEDWQIQFRNIA